MSNPLTIILDAAQDRLAVDMLSTLVSGRDWSPTDWSDIYVDPVTNTAMLMPGCGEASWTTSNSGIYSKLASGAFTLTDSGNWQSQAADQSGPFMLYTGPNGNTSGLQGITTTTWPANQPMVVEFFMQGGTNGGYIAIEFGWSATGDGSSGVSCRVYSDGRIEVWKAGAIVGTYNLGGKSPDYFSAGTSQGMQLGGGATHQAPRTGYNLLLLLPCRDRELLVLSSGGGGFSHVFEDLAEGAGGLTITDNAPFWFNVPAPAAANIRISPCQFESTGTICGAPSAWRNTPDGSLPAPTVANGNLIVYAPVSNPAPSDTAGRPVVPQLVGSPPNPYSVANPVQLMVTLNGSGASTPFVYGVRAQYPPVTAQTSAVDLNVTDYTVACRFEVSDTVGGTRASLALMQPAAIEDAGGAGITTLSSRAIQFSDEIGMLLNGISEPPRWADCYGNGEDAYDRGQEIEMAVRDEWKLLENYRFSDPIPLGSYSLAAAYALVATAGGLPLSRIYCSPSCASFVLDAAPATASGNGMGPTIDVGDTAAEWLDRLHQTYAGTFFHGFRPNGASAPVLSLIDPADTSGSGLPSTPSLTLYADYAAAVAAGKSWQQVMRSYQTQVLEPESNDVWVMGADARTQKPIVAHLADLASQAVGTAPSSRPANWLGAIRKYGWVDPSISTIAMAQACAQLLYNRLDPARTLVEFECEYLPGIWRGDILELIPQSGTPVHVRVKTFRGGFEYVAAAAGSNAVWRPCTYVCEVVQSGLAAPLDVDATSLAMIAQLWHQVRALSKRRIFDDGDIIGRRPVLNLQEV